MKKKKRNVMCTICTKDADVCTNCNFGCEICMEYNYDEDMCNSPGATYCDELRGFYYEHFDND